MAIRPLGGGPAGLQIIDPVLSNLARQYHPHGFIYDSIIASQTVPTNSGQYPVFDLAKFFAARGDTQVADDAATPIIDFNWDTEFYRCQDYRLRTRLTRKEALQVNDALHLEVTKVTGLLGIMALEREKRLASKLLPEAEGGKLAIAAKNPSEISGGAKWDVGTEATPAKIQKDVQIAGQEVYKRTGIRPNTLVFTEQIALAISQDPSVINIIKYLAGTEFIASGNVVGSAGLQSVGNGSFVLPKKLWGFDLVIADGVLENAAAEGATASLKEIWGNFCRVLYVNKNAVWGTPTVAYGFRGKVQGSFEGAVEPASGSVSQLEPAGTGSYAVVDRWQEPDPPAENIRAWECVDEKIVAPEAGFVIKEVLEKP